MSLDADPAPVLRSRLEPDGELYAADRDAMFAAISDVPSTSPRNQWRELLT